MMQPTSLRLSHVRAFLTVGTLATLVLIATTATSADKPVQGDKIRFNRDIRPILSENCFACHGPDPGNRKAGLRLDREEDLFADRDGSPAVVRGKPDESVLFDRIAHAKVAKMMPPPKSHKKLTEAQKELIKKWIEQGAPWEPHWSFVAPQRSEAPKVANNGWVRNPIDAFILAELEKRGLAPAPEADRRTLIRRLALDLTGLPPEPQDVERFVNDQAPNAYEKLVDRLLTSKSWGEHRARYWLDAARYADTHGLHFDNYREMYPYRDWVIDAYNKNLRFDRFTIEQLAGDLLPNRTLDNQIATGFHRCNITTNEGGVIVDEVEAAYAKDRVETTTTVWLGLTGGCAACHDHKFDPFSQKDFYRFVAYFRNHVQRTMDGNVPDSPPVIVVPKPEDRARWIALQKEIADLQAQRDARLKDAQPAFREWLANGEGKKITEPVDAKDLHLNLPLHEGQGKAAGKRGDKDLSLDLAEGVTWGAGQTPQQKAVHFGPKGKLDVADTGDFEADQHFTIGAWVFLPAQEDTYAVMGKTETKGKDIRGWALDIGARIVSFKLMGDGNSTLTVGAPNTHRLEAGKWSHVAVSYDGSRKATGVVLYVNGKPLPPNRPQNVTLKGSIRNTGSFHLGADGRREFKGGAIHGLRIANRTLRPEEVSVVSKWEKLEVLVAKDPKMLNPQERQDLLQLYVQRKDERYGQINTELTDREHEQQDIRQRSPVTHVMEEKPNSVPKARLLFRGLYDQPREELVAGTPTAMHAFPKDAPNNRMGLALWLVDAKNPLTARVTVNRHWQEVFGTGLVRTSEDFGIMGEQPSHPELLDWLALEFREKGWDVKALFRLMVTSATYRQSAAATPDKLKKDPTNRLLSRGPRFRLEGEALRDQALAASGLLVSRIGGPSVRPYMPTGIWEAVAMYGSNTRDYRPDKGEGLYRRSMYTFWKRSAPPSSMDIFNAPSREGCTVRRERTNTPLQALVTMNDPQFVEAARHLAQRAILEGGPSFDQRLDFLTMRLVSRPFEKREREICQASITDFLAHYKEKQGEAQKLIQTGESKPDPKVNATELAAWTMLANQLMNLDEVLNK